MMINLLKLSSEHAASISTNELIGLIAIYQVSDKNFRRWNLLIQKIHGK